MTRGTKTDQLPQACFPKDSVHFRAAQSWGGLRRGLVLGFLELQLAKFLGDILTMRTDFHLVVNVGDLSLLVDEECCPTGKRPILDKSIRLGHFPARITQNRIVKLQFFCESGIGFDVVATRSEVCDVKFAEDFAALTERLALGRSAPGKRFRKPGDHDSLLPFEIGQFVFLAVAADQFEAGRQFPHFGRFVLLGGSRADGHRQAR